MYHNGDVQRLYARPQPNTVSNPTNPRNCDESQEHATFAIDEAFAASRAGRINAAKIVLILMWNVLFTGQRKREASKEINMCTMMETFVRRACQLLLELTNGHVDNSRLNGPQGDQGKAVDSLIQFPLAAEHRNMVLANLDKIQDLVSVYFEVVYPCK